MVIYILIMIGLVMQDRQPADFVSFDFMDLNQLSISLINKLTPT